MSRWESDPRQYAADRLAAGKTLADLLPADHEPETAAPNDFRLCTASCQHFDPVRAELVIDVLEDGTVDVRGVADQWLHGEGAFTVEGTGNPSLAPPGS